LNGKPLYCCTFLNQYAAKNETGHPTSVYVREEQLLPVVDAWLARKLGPVAFTAAVREYESQRPQPQPDEDARQEIADCDAKLRQHRAALEASADRSSSRAG
jgi:site-specific DNA recombinase